MLITKFKKLALALISLLFVAGLWVPTALAVDIEPLHGVNVTKEGCAIVVTSTGCTQKEDFIPILQKSQPPIVTFIRLKPDSCRAASRPYLIQFSLEEIGAKEFTISNLFEPGPSYF